MAEKRVFVVGSLNADHRVRVRDIPKPGETVLGSDVIVAAGGKGANQAVAAARAGAKAVLIGATGADRDGDSFGARRRGSGRRPPRTRGRGHTDRSRADHRRQQQREHHRRIPWREQRTTEGDIDAGLQAATGETCCYCSSKPRNRWCVSRPQGRRRRMHGDHERRPGPRLRSGPVRRRRILVVNQHELAEIADLLRHSTNGDNRDDDMALLAAASGARWSAPQAMQAPASRTTALLNTSPQLRSTRWTRPPRRHLHRLLRRGADGRRAQHDRGDPDSGGGLGDRRHALRCHRLDSVSPRGEGRTMKIALGNDHAGFSLKAHVRAVIEALGHEVIDCGPRATTRSTSPTSPARPVISCAQVGRIAQSSSAEPAKAP